MVCHETYKDSKNNWISPEEILTINGKKFLKENKNQEVKVGPSESMSKSKKNTVDPERIIEDYGADSVRLFILSDSPPEKDVQWSDEGMKSSFKFIQKLWVLNQKILEEIKQNHPKNASNDLEKLSNKFVKNVKNNIENFSYNKIIANFHELYTSLNKIINSKFKKQSWIENYKNILISMSPVIPHFSNECLEKLNLKEKIKWPTINENILVEKKINFVVQVNGKTRGVINTDLDIEKKELLIKISEIDKIKKHFEDKEIKNTIFIPNKLINIIV